MLYLLIGLLIGSYGTLVGVGGGFLLTPILLIFHNDLPPSILTAASLAIIFINTFFGSIIYAFQRRIDYRSFILFGLATTPGAILGNWLVQYIPRTIFNPIIGFTLLIFSIFLFLKNNSYLNYLPKISQLICRTKSDRVILLQNGQSQHYQVDEWGGIWSSLLVGSFSTFLGIGGGVLHVPIMTSFLGFPPHIASSTSHPIIAVTTAIATLINWKLGNLSHLKSILPWLAGGVIIGAPIGAYISQFIHGKTIIKLLAIALALVGLRLLLS